MLKSPSTQLYAKDGDQCVVMLMQGNDATTAHHHHHNDNTLSSSSSTGSSSSLDTTTEDDDASSSSNESLYNLSDLMAQLPIKGRGLSKYYRGRSQSFTCLSRAKSIEDLGKKESGYTIIHKRKMMKACSKSFQGGLDNYKSFIHHHPKPIISKKTTTHFRRNILLPVQENRSK